MPAPSLDAEARSFPVPAGSTLLNAQITAGSGAGASRLLAWASPLSFDATTAFYAAMSDARWRVAADPLRTANSATIELFDGSGLFSSAQAHIVRTNPVRITAILTGTQAPPSRPPTTSSSPLVATLPPASALPDGFPTRLVPAGGTLTDAGATAGTFFATFSAPGDVETLAAAYKVAMTGWAVDIIERTSAGAITIDFMAGGNPGEIVLVPGSSGTTVGIEVTP